MTAADRNPDRNPGWDQLKAFATLLVVFHHTAITYGGSGGWFYREHAADGALQSVLLTIFCATNQAWFMGLFFLLAGRFVQPALARRGAVGFMRDRLLRLGLPLLLFVAVLGPLTVALADTAQGDPFVGSLRAIWQRKIFIPGPLWFAQALLLMSLAAALWWRFGPARRAAAASPAAPSAASSAAPLPSDRTLLLAALGCGAVAFALRLVWPVGAEVWHLQLGYFASYVLLFAVGCLAAQPRWLEHLPAQRVRHWRRVAWCTLPLLLPLVALGKVLPVFAAAPHGGFNLPSLLYAFWEPFVAWGVLLGLLLVFSRPGAPLPPWRQALARRAYAIYVIHPLVLVAVCLAWRGVMAPPLLKFVVSGAVACLACHVVAGWLLRLPGVRRVL